MLPRVSAALAQFIAPVSSSDKKSSEASFERFSQRQQASQRQPSGGDSGQNSEEQTKRDKPPAQVVPIRGKAPEASADSKAALPDGQPKEGAPTGRAGIANAFLSLMSLLQFKKNSVSKGAGARSYESAAEQQNQRAKFRKGAMLDRKAE